jgi:hypothetical protein
MGIVSLEVFTICTQLPLGSFTCLSLSVVIKYEPRHPAGIQYKVACGVNSN